MVNRIVVGAHYGLKDWLIQRLSAIVMAIYAVLFVVQVWALPSFDLVHWRALFAGGFMRIASFLFLLALVYHAWIGVRDIFMDYIKPTGIRLLLHTVTVLFLAGCLGWGAQILWRVQ